MEATLSRTADRHTWRLTACRVTQVCVDPASVRIQAWTLQASLEVRIGVVASARPAEGAHWEFDPDRPMSAAPFLALIGVTLDELDVTRTGTLALTFGNGTVIEVPSHPDYEAFEIHGGGQFETLGYLASPGGGSPWG